MSGAWQAVRTLDGSWTLAHPVHGQTCHSRAGAWQEARERYAAACRLRERAHACGTLRLLDVGTGLGLNLAAALEALAGTGARLEAWTLENDAGVLAATAQLPSGPPQVERWHAPLRRALARGCDGPLRTQGLPPEAPEHELVLLLGDARATLERAGVEPFDAIFLDAFSPRVEPDLWSAEFLARLAGRLAPQGILSTYTVSLPVRRALASAGLRVGCGPTVGTKASGTLASPRAHLPPLDARTQRRLERPARGLGSDPRFWPPDGESAPPIS